MADETQGTAGADDARHGEGTGNGANTGRNSGDAPGTGERDTWTRDDWEAFANSEADRRVTDALKRKETEYKELLADTKKTAEEKLSEYETKLAQESARAEFHAQAVAKGVSDVKAAWAVAREYGLIENGKVQWSRLKEGHPALFASAAPPSSAGRTSDTASGAPDMNELLRNAVAGR